MAQKLTWTGQAPEGGDLTAEWTWTRPDQYRQNVLVRNAVGQVMMEVQSTTTRK